MGNLLRNPPSSYDALITTSSRSCPGHPAQVALHSLTVSNAFPRFHVPPKSFQASLQLWVNSFRVGLRGYGCCFYCYYSQRHWRHRCFRFCFCYKETKTWSTHSGGKCEKENGDGHRATTKPATNRRKVEKSHWPLREESNNNYLRSYFADTEIKMQHWQRNRGSGRNYLRIYNYL